MKNLKVITRIVVIICIMQFFWVDSYAQAPCDAVMYDTIHHVPKGNLIMLRIQSVPLIMTPKESTSAINFVLNKNNKYVFTIGNSSLSDGEARVRLLYQNETMGEKIISPGNYNELTAITLNTGLYILEVTLLNGTKGCVVFEIAVSKE